MATKKKTTNTEVWPRVVKGTHLTVTTFEDGSTKLEWDDEVLLQEVRAAILKYESNVPASVQEGKPKKRTKKSLADN